MDAHLPQHVALIMDGNRRWAEKKGLPKFEGHRQGLKRTREIVDECLSLGIPHCTLWCFSTENWKRDQKEVDYLMKLFEEYLNNHVQELHEKGIRIHHIGRKDRLPKELQELFSSAEVLTQENTALTVHLAIDYGGRDEILRAVEKACAKGKSSWTEADFSLILDTAGSPDPDFIIRTSGEHRLSGFLLWQSTYSELYFTDTCFPDFGTEAFQKALDEYQSRKRSYGS